MRLISLAPLLLLCCWASFVSAHAHEVDSLLKRARALYYQSVNDEKNIDPAIEMFAQISQRSEKYQGRALTYIGSLTALRAKFAFWPHEKWKAANDGLRLMDRGLAGAPDDIEALFIHGATCYFLPAFFGRADDAQRHLKKIVGLLPAHAQKYDAGLVANVVRFIAQAIRLNEQERKSLADVNLSLAQK
jgi:hypothetical protein